MEKNQRNSNQLNQAEQELVQKRVEYILEVAKRKGATAAEVFACIDIGLAVSVRMAEVDTVEFNRGKGFSITVYFDQRKGSASTSDVSNESIEQTVEAACHIAKMTGEDPYAGLADQALMAFDYPNLDLSHPWDINSAEAINLALECEELAMSSDPRINNSEGVAISSHQSFAVYGNSHGFIGSVPTTRHNIQCVLVAQDEQGMERDYYYTTGRHPGDLESLKTVAEQAAQRTVAHLGARQIATCSAPVIFAADIAKTLFSHFFSAIAGGNLYRKSTFLLDSVGQTLFPQWLSISENPLEMRGQGSAAFDSDGVRTSASDIVTAGVIQRYILSEYSARRLGMHTTANAGGVRNVILRSEQSPEFTDLLKQMGSGLLVTELMGQGVNITTGDYSRGASGFWVENGEIQYPVNEITIAGQLKNMFAGIQAVANDIDKRGNIQSGSILLDEMTIAGS